jgi:glycosyltransferase involved in cell wall biosynthesis
MRVAMLSYPLLATRMAFSGGGGTVNEMIKTALEEVGHTVDYLTYPCPVAPNDRRPGALARFLDLAVVRAYRYADHVNRLAAGYDLLICDSVVCYGLRHPRCINLFNFSHYGYGKHVAKLPSGLAGELKYRLLTLLERFETRDKFNIAVSPFLARQLAEEGLSVFRVVNNAVDTEMFRPDSGVAKNDRILYAGNDDYLGKGFDLLHKLAGLGVAIDCATNSDPGGGLNHVGMVAREGLPALFNRYRILVYPSRFETFGLVPLEAMACGLPVVIANTGFAAELKAAIPEFVLDGHDDAAVSDYAARIELLREDYPTFSRRAREFVLEHYSRIRFNREWQSLAVEVFEMKDGGYHG